MSADARYEEQCAWCSKDLAGQYVTGVATYEWDPSSNRYCSAECAGKARSELFTRRKHYGEKWPRYSVEVPPELAALLDAAQRNALGVNASSASRPGLVRGGLRLMLDRLAPIEDPAIESTAVDVIELLALEPGETDDET